MAEFLEEPSVLPVGLTAELYVDCRRRVYWLGALRLTSRRHGNVGAYMGEPRRIYSLLPDGQVIIVAPTAYF